MDPVVPFHDYVKECDADDRNAVDADVERGDGGGADAAVGEQLAAAGNYIVKRYLSWALRYSRGLTFL